MYRLLKRAGIAAALVTLTSAAPAAAHITLAEKQAVAGSTYKAVLRVPHGCEGSPTQLVRVAIPLGVDNVKPMPHAGWQLTTRKAKRALDDGSIAEGVVEITWSGGALPNDWYDEFVFRAALPDAPGTTLYFPVVQECAKGANHWLGTEAESDKEPAPMLMLLPGRAP